MNDMMGMPPTYRGALPTIAPYSPYKPEFQQWTPGAMNMPSNSMPDSGAGALSSGASALGKGLGARKPAAAPGASTSMMPTAAEASPFFLGGGAETASFAPSSFTPGLGSGVAGAPEYAMAADFSGAGAATGAAATPTIGSSLGWGAGGTSAASMPALGASSGGSAAAFSNPFTAIPAAIAANEITAHGSDRRPGGTWDQIKFDLAGKAPAADMHALSQKWNLGDAGKTLEGAANFASVDPRDWGKGAEKIGQGASGMFSKGVSGLKNFFGW